MNPHKVSLPELDLISMKIFKLKIQFIREVVFENA